LHAEAVIEEVVPDELDLDLAGLVGVGLGAGFGGFACEDGLVEVDGLACEGLKVVFEGAVVFLLGLGKARTAGDFLDLLMTPLFQAEVIGGVVTLGDLIRGLDGDAEEGFLFVGEWDHGSKS
jgi:hypothetical protein